jgi:hypothetical protein
VDGRLDFEGGSVGDTITFQGRATDEVGNATAIVTKTLDLEHLEPPVVSEQVGDDEGARRFSPAIPCQVDINAVATRSADFYVNVKFGGLVHLRTPTSRSRLSTSRSACSSTSTGTSGTTTTSVATARASA